MSVKKRRGILVKFVFLEFLPAHLHKLAKTNKTHRTVLSAAICYILRTLHPEKGVNLKIDDEQNSLKFWSLGEGKD